MSDDAASDQPTAVWLLNMGGPDRIEAVQPFLQNLLGDYKLIRFAVPWLQPVFAWIISRYRTPKVAPAYASMGGASPQLAIVDDQVEALQWRLGPSFRVSPVLRYWGPSAKDAAAKLQPGQPVVLLSLYPQASDTTTGSSIEDARLALTGHSGPLHVIESYPADPLYIDALCETIDQALEGLSEPHILFSAHGLPKRYIADGDPYLAEIQATVAAASARFEQPKHLSFQSRVGLEEWLEPNTIDKVVELGAAGVKELVVVPVAFTSDHIETLVEIGEEIREEAEAAGVVTFSRADAVNARPTFIEALARLVLQKVDPSTSSRSEGAEGA